MVVLGLRAANYMKLVARGYVAFSSTHRNMNGVIIAIHQSSMNYIFLVMDALIRPRCHTIATRNM
jgi:hypothetical protein